MPVVVETEQIPNRENSPLESRAKISDGLPYGNWRSTKEICAWKSARYDG
jgi:hypothetical protein